MQACALVPFKNFSQSKQRLRSVLDDHLREQLVAAMLEDTLRAVRSCSTLEACYLLSDDQTARELAQGLGWQCLAENPAARGLNASVDAAVAELAQDFDTVLIVHGDLPVLQGEEVASIVDSHAQQLADSAQAMTLAGDACREGSNCLMLSPPNAFALQYGHLSFEKHLAIAAERGIQSTTLALPGAALDIDQAEDLQTLQACALLRAESATAKALAQIGEGSE